MSLKQGCIFHAPDGIFAYPSARDRLVVRLRTGRGDLRRAFVRWADRYTHPRTADAERAMRRAARDGLFDYWEAEITLGSGRFSYHFVLDDGRKEWWYGAEGLSAGPPPAAHLWRWGFSWPYTWWSEEMEPPAWAREAVVYQIFPERFANGDPGNDPPGTRPWGEKPAPASFFGGDLRGISEHLDHLTELGVNCLYLTPVFSAPSNHKYDTADYLAVDPAFGDGRALEELVRSCHTRGIRVILDGVFNHAGVYWAPFQDVIQKGLASPYAGWFKIHSFPVRTGPVPNYETFGSVWFMPKLNTAHPGLRAHLIDVAEHWTRVLRIDGWRLDVADEVHPEFWREFRRRIRAVNPEALLVGEIMHEAAPWLAGDQMDAVMNYPLQHLAVDFFGGGAVDAATFAGGVGRSRLRYRAGVVEACWNPLDSHDRPRLLTACRGDETALKLATVFQFTARGVPYIYYGTEVGLEGENDPDCRRCMPWDRAQWNEEIYRHYRALIRLRRGHAVFVRGEQAELLADAATGLFVMARWHGGEAALVLINTGNKAVTVSGVDLSGPASDYGCLDALAGEYELAFAAGSGPVKVPARMRLDGRRGREGRLVVPGRAAAVYVSAGRAASLI
ncbi:MAG: glycoside hydrolase family 13 protein [Bacteroidota bacterium]